MKFTLVAIFIFLSAQGRTLDQIEPFQLQSNTNSENESQGEFARELPREINRPKFQLS